MGNHLMFDITYTPERHPDSDQTVRLAFVFDSEGEVSAVMTCTGYGDTVVEPIRAIRTIISGRMEILVAGNEKFVGEIKEIVPLVEGHY